MNGDRSRARTAMRSGTAIAALTAAALAAGCSNGPGHNQNSTPEISATNTGKMPSALGSAATRLIFVSNRSGEYEIYQKDLSSDRITALTTGSNNMNPELSPDSKRIVFYSDRSGSNQIDVLSLQQPENVTQLTDDTDGINNYDPAFTPDGRILYKKSDQNGSYGDIWEMNGDGSNQHPLTAGLSSHNQEGWKPTPLDNSQAIITVRLHQGDPYSDNLVSLDLGTGHTTQLTNNGLPNWYPDYSPEANKVVFVTKQERGGHDVIDTMSPFGGDHTTIIGMPGDNDDPSWDNSGTNIAFLNNRSGQYDVYSASADGAGVKLLDQSPNGSQDLSPLLIP